MAGLDAFQLLDVLHFFQGEFGPWSLVALLMSAVAISIPKVFGPSAVTQVRNIVAKTALGAMANV